MIAGLATTALLLVAAPAAAGPLPIVKATWADTYLPPGGKGLFELQVRNAGDAALGPGLTITDDLPAGVRATKVSWNKHPSQGGIAGAGAETCAISEAGTRVTCTLDDFDLALGLGVAPGVQHEAFTPAPSGYLPTPGSPIEIQVEVAPGAAATATNTATIANPATLATVKDGGPGQDETQALTVRAGAGKYRLTATTATGTGTLAGGAKEVTGVSTSLGAFHLGDVLSGAGIATGVGNGEIEAGSEVVANARVFERGAFAPGEAISGYGIAAATTITAVEETSPETFELTLSAPATASGRSGLLANTTVTALGAGALTLSAAATQSGPQALSATETSAAIDWNAPAAGPASLQAALAALPGIGSGNVSVEGGPGDAAGSSPYLIGFGGALAGKNLAPLAPATAAVPLSGGAPDFTDEDPVPFSSEPSPFGIVPGSFLADVFDRAFPFGAPSRQAGDHPFEQRVDFDLNRFAVEEGGELRWSSPKALIRTVEATLPRGMIGNPEALPKCAQADFAEEGSYKSATGCPANTQVGYLTVKLIGGPGTIARVPIYSLEPPRGTPVDLGFQVGGYVQGHIYATLDPAQGYAIKTVTPDIGALIPALGTEVTVWGVPADPAHDFFRVYPEEQANEDVAGAPFEGPIRPFFTNPMDCGADNGGTRIRVESYAEPGVMTPVQEYGNPDNVSGCGDLRFRFQPEVALQPTDRHAGAPTGLDVHLEVPQRNDEVKNAEELYATEGDGTLKEEGAVQAISTPPIKKAVVTLPEGMTINPSAAQGLGSCTPAQIGLGTNDPVTCPDNSQYGTLTLHTPILPVNEQPKGYVYIARQNDNPFHNFLSLYLVIEEPVRGVLVKIPGKVDLNPVTGQITTTFDELPQFPMSDMQMTLKGGLRAGLVEPQTCGQKTIEATFYSWQDPTKPNPVKSSYDVTQNPDGSPCHNSLGERPFDPQLTGGTLNNTAGSFSPLELRMTRTDEDQELSVVEGTAPPGLTASLRGVAECSDAQIAAAEAPGRTGTEEQNNPSCPAASQVGTVDAGAGVGQVLTYVKGRIYLAGPYKGAPVSGVAIVPAVAGPFDLGTIVTRAPAYVNPETAQISLKTDPLPQIFKGVPVRVRDIRVHLDREGFTLNPTSCEAMSLDGTLFSAEGKSKAASNRFQVADCASLGFRPKLFLKLKGGTRRGSHPALTATLRARPGDANIAGAQVTLPHSEFLDQAHIKTICTRVQFAATECPAGSVYGTAVAKTPLFDQPLEGPVYLRSSSHNLPDLVAALKGPASLPVEVDLDGRIDSVNGGIRNTFEVVPDAPVTEFTLSMQGGKKGLLINSTDLCARTSRATAKFTAQNGRRITLRPALQSACGKAGRHGKKHKRAGR